MKTTSGLPSLNHYFIISLLTISIPTLQPKKLLHSTTSCPRIFYTSQNQIIVKFVSFTMGNGSSKSEPALDQSSGSRSTNNGSSDKQKNKSIRKKRIKTAKKPEIMGIMSEMNPELVLGMIETMKRGNAEQKQRRGGAPKAA
jgi:hypothetical protein